MDVATVGMVALLVVPESALPKPTIYGLMAKFPHQPAHPSKRMVPTPFLPPLPPPPLSLLIR